jgi:hypothetical protein
MKQVLYFYIALFCTQYEIFQDVPGVAGRLVAALANWYFVPTVLALIFAVYWFNGARASDRIVNQRVVLRGFLAALIAWLVAEAIGLAWSLALSGAQWTDIDQKWACWHGSPTACPAAAVGFALGATLWRRDWRWGLGCNLIVCLWAVTQIFAGVCYPIDVIVGTVIGLILAWLLDNVAWLDRPLDVLIYLVRRLMMA